MKAAFFGLIGHATAIAIAIAIVGARHEAPSAASTGSVPHYQAAAVRAVTLTTGGQVSRGQGPVLVELVDGAIPAGVTQLTVLTDENCVPDAAGVSHCLNRVRFMGPNGPGEATLRHHHRMSEEPCLAPGETVTLGV